MPHTGCTVGAGGKAGCSDIAGNGGRVQSKLEGRAGKVTPAFFLKFIFLREPSLVTGTSMLSPQPGTAWGVFEPRSDTIALSNLEANSSALAMALCLLSLHHEAQR